MSEYLVLSVNRTKNLELADVLITCMEGSVSGSLVPDPRPVDRPIPICAHDDVRGLGRHT